jgi:hypothetical protein
MKTIILIFSAFFAITATYAQIDSACLSRINSMRNDSLIFLSDIRQHNDTFSLKRNNNIEKLQEKIQNQKYVNLQNFIFEMKKEQYRNHIMQNTFNINNNTSMGREFRFGIVTDIITGTGNNIFKKNNSKPKIKPSKKF